jgi:hypothetical protein
MLYTGYTHYITFNRKPTYYKPFASYDSGRTVQLKIPYYILFSILSDLEHDSTTEQMENILSYWWVYIQQITSDKKNLSAIAPLMLVVTP